MDAYYELFGYGKLFGNGIKKNTVSKNDLTGLASQLRTITKEDALDDYNKLKEVDCKVNNDTRHVGNKATDLFFLQYRLLTTTKKGMSFPESLKTDEYNKPYYKKFIEKAVKNGRSIIEAKYSAFRLYSGSISAFKPIIARRLYCMFNPTTILDFSAGWGGRCLGAMSLDINYIGFDTNIALKSAYKNMIKMYPHTSDVKIYFKDSSKVDYSKFKYDMVFTSPPYYLKTKPTEAYQNMPIYKDRDDFNERFFFLVVSNTWKNLQNNGVYALNIPIDMYNDIKPILGKAHKEIPLQISQRASEERLGGNYKEFIYIWYKTL